MERVTITRIETRDGNSNGKPWRKVGIQTQKHGEKWLSCFFNKYNEKQLAELKVGDSVELVVSSSSDGKYLNFTLPSRTDKLEARIAVIEQRLGIGSVGSSSTAQQGHPTHQSYVQDDVNPEDIPF